MGSPLTLVLLLTVLGQAAPQYPPPYPRPGTTPLFENTAVAVWDVAWLKQKYPLHTHRYDLIGVSYVEGDRIITQGDAPGRQTPTTADGVQQVVGAPSWDNRRAYGWAIPPGTAVASHRHVRDAVELVFSAATPAVTPKVSFVPAGTVHAGPAPEPGGRVFIFEIK